MTLYDDLDEAIEELEELKGSITAMENSINTVTDRCVNRGIPLEHVQIIVEEFTKG